MAQPAIQRQLTNDHCILEVGTLLLLGEAANLPDARREIEAISKPAKG